ncbi:unnamed protein product, partial [Durusdinium trenchii]
ERMAGQYPAHLERTICITLPWEAYWRADRRCWHCWHGGEAADITAYSQLEHSHFLEGKVLDALTELRQPWTLS